MLPFLERKNKLKKVVKKFRETRWIFKVRNFLPPTLVSKQVL